MTKLVKWNPFMDPFEEAEKMLSDFVPSIRHSNNNFMPAVDMYEDENNVIVECQLAGIDPEKVNISVENDSLCIKGEGEQKNEVEDKNYYRKEIRRGSFYRSIPLPGTVDQDNAKATTKGGVLTITLPKKEEAQAKTIKIESK